MTQPTEYQGPLAGIQVLDFGHYYAGPMVGMLLADQGANVIRIVQPGKKELPEQQYRLLNRNKKSLRLDLKKSEDKEQVSSLIEQADVIIENYRPGVMKRLGLHYSTVKNRNPGLIYLSLPGFASTDKERSHIQAWEGVMAAAAGVYTDTHPLRYLLNFPPVYTWVPQCSAYGAIHGAIAVISALIARREHGFGTPIEVPLAEAGLSGFAPYFAHDSLGVPRTQANERQVKAANQVPAPLKPFEYSSGDSQAVQMQKLKEANEPRMTPFYGTTYTCADGRKILFHGADGIKPIDRILKVFGLDKRLKNEGFVNEGPWVLGIRNNMSNAWQMDPEKSRYIKQLVTEVILTKTAKEWETLLQNSRVAVSIVRTREEWMAEPALQKSTVFVELNNGQSVLVVPGRVADISGPNDSLMSTRPHEMGTIDPEQANALFSQHAPVHASDIDVRTLNKGDLLKGLKVLDLSYVVAGPTSSYTLAQYGANVIKLNQPIHEHPGLIKGMLDANQGKRSILMNVQTAPGREVFERLVSWADVIVHNYPDDTAKRLGVTHKQLQAINPKVVSCQLTAFGGTYRGGWERRRGFDPMAQAASGIMAQFGTPDEPQWHGQTSCGDTMGGLGLAFSALLGVYQQRETGYAGEGRTSLARMINYIQLPCMIAENGRSQWGESHGQFAVGPDWWQRLYKCRDGWIYVGARKDRAEALAEIVAGQEIADEHSLEPVFAERDCAFWLEQLKAADIGCHRVLSIADICRKEARQVGNEPANETATGGSELLRWEDHPCGYPIILGAPDWVRVGEHHSYLRLSPAPRFGEHTRDILKELKFSDDVIDELIDLKICHEYIPTMGGKDAYLFGWKIDL